MSSPAQATASDQAPPRTPRARARAAVSRLLPPPGPQRVLVASVLTVTVGGGLLLGNSTLYLIRVVGMSTNEVGVGLTIGAAIGLVAGPLVGHLADQYGPKQVHIISMLCGAAATAGFVLTRAFWELVLVSLGVTLVGAAANASRAPLIRALAGEHSTRYLSYQRAITNVGIMVGIAFATIGIQLNSAPVYITLILISAATFLGAGAILIWLPHVKPIGRSPAQRQWVALTDRPYLTITVLNGAMSVYLAIPTFALPLWIVNYTSVPRAAVTGFVLVNGLLVVALQVRVSRGVTDPVAAGKRMRWAGFALLVSSGLIGSMADLAAWTALLLLLVAAVVYSLGEIWQAVASFELMFGLALPQAQGQYSGAFGLGQGAANAAAPAVLAGLCLDHGLPGWLILGVLLAALGLATPYGVGWALRCRLAA